MEIFSTFTMILYSDSKKCLQYLNQTGKNIRFFVKRKRRLTLLSLTNYAEISLLPINIQFSLLQMLLKEWNIINSSCKYNKHHVELKKKGKQQETSSNMSAINVRWYCKYVRLSVSLSIFLLASTRFRLH